MNVTRLVVLAVLLATPAFGQAKKEPPTKEPPQPRAFKYSVYGLFMPGRDDDLKDLVKEEMPEVKLLGVDYKNAEAEFEYTPETLFPGTKPQDLTQRFDQKLRQASHGTFGVRPLRTTPTERLKWVEIGVAGLDCKACSFAAYEAVAKLAGVEQATASFKTGKVTALIDPEKLKVEDLEAALKKKGVSFPGKSPTP